MSSSAAGKTEGTPLVKKEEEKEESPMDRVYTIVAISLLIIIVVAKTQLTSFLFSTLHYPTAYSWYSVIITDLMLIPAFFIWPSQWGMPTMEMFTAPHYALTLIIVFTSLDLAFTNIALAEISVSLQQCIAATNPFWTMVIESLLHRKCQHPIVYGAIAGLVLGAALSVFSDIDKISMQGVLSACLAVLCSSSKTAFTHNAFKKYKSVLGPLALLFWVDLLMLPIFTPWVLINRELFDLLDSGMDAAAWWQFTGTAALGGVRALTQMAVLSRVSGTSTSVANVFTMAINITLSFFLNLSGHQPEITPLLITGVSLVVIFSAVYTYLKVDKYACGGIMVPSAA